VEAAAAASSEGGDAAAAAAAEAKASLQHELEAERNLRTEVGPGKYCPPHH